MKKTMKTKLRLNSQIIRDLRAVNGGRVPMELPSPDDTMNCTIDCTVYCTAGCRGCG